MYGLLMPIASLFVFIIIEEVLNAMIKEDQHEGKLQGIKFPRSHELYFMVLYIIYIDDTNFIIK